MFRVLHEPLGEPYYYGPQRMSKRFNAENSADLMEQHQNLTFDAVRRNHNEFNRAGSDLLAGMAKHRL